MLERQLAMAAEANGDEDLSRRLRVQIKLGLITMSGGELWELAKLTVDPPTRREQ